MSDGLIIANNILTLTPELVANFKQMVTHLQPQVSQVFVSCAGDQLAAWQQIVNGTAVTLLPEVAPVIGRGPIGGVWSYFYHHSQPKADLIILDLQLTGVSDAVVSLLQQRPGYLNTAVGSWLTCCHLRISETNLAMQLHLRDYDWANLLLFAGCGAVEAPTVGLQLLPQQAS